MSSTQNKVVEKIKQIAKEANLDADFEWSWSNVAHVYFRKDFETVANMAIDFQGSYLTVALNKGHVNAQYFGNADFISYINYTENSKFQAFFKVLQETL